MNNPAPSSPRRRKTQQIGKVDDDTSRSASQKKQFISRPVISESSEAQAETSQPDDHEIELATSNAPGHSSAEHTEDDSAPANEIHDDGSELDGYGTAEEQNAEEQRMLTGLADHRWYDGEIQVNVEWRGGALTWEPERNVHLDAPEILFEYWDAQGERPTNPEDPESFDIVAIRGHSKRRLLVEWTGYPPSENTWLPRKELKETAPDVVEEYLEDLKSK